MELTAAALWLNTVFAAFDQSVAAAVHQLYVAAGGFFTPFLETLSLFGYTKVIVPIAIVLILFKKTRRYGVAILLSMAVGALITNCCLKIVVARPRPYVDPNGFFYPLWVELGQHMEADLSFPSGHATASFALSFAIFLVGDKRYSWLALLIGFTMGISRIYLVVHYPSDVLGGALVGTIGAFVGTPISKKLPAKVYEMDNFFITRKKNAA